MNKEDIIEMAKQVGMMSEVLQLGRNLELLTDFARLVAEKEREACAEICEWSECAGAIRARGQE